MKNLTLGILWISALIPFLSSAQTSPCTPHNHPSNTMRDKGFTDKGGQTVANDFQLSANTLIFAVQQIKANLWTEEGSIASIDIVFHENDNENPGAVVGDTIANLIPTSQLIIGVDSQFDIRDVVLDLPQPFVLAGTGTAAKKYWLEIIATPSIPGKRIGWELNGVDVVGQGINYTNPNVNFWMVNENWDGVFSISGECTIAEGCLIPENLGSSNITSSSAEVSWQGFSDAANFELEYGYAGFEHGSGTVVNVAGDVYSFVLDGLDLATNYDVYIKTICDTDESISAFPLTFSTLDTYCEIEALVLVQPISYVNFAGIENTTSANLGGTPGHEFFLDIVANVVAGNSYDIIVRGNTGGYYSDGFTAFIDWNQDGEFNNISERYDLGVIFDSDGLDGQQIVSTIEVPSDAIPGKTRLRIVKEFFEGDYTVDACTSLGYGQIEDYSIEVETLGSALFNKYSFSFFPNPAQESISFESSVPLTDLVFYNIMGQPVISKSINASSSQIDISNLPLGLYFVKVNINGANKTFKVIKE